MTASDDDAIVAGTCAIPLAERFASDYLATGDLMAEDPLCTHTPGTFAGSPLLMLPTVKKRRNLDR